MSKKNRKKKDALNGADHEWAASVVRRTGGIMQRLPLPEGKKVSDAVAEFAEPLLDAFAEDDQDRVNMLTFACGLWNLAIMRNLNKKMFAEAESVTMLLLADDPFFLRPDEALNLLSAMFNRWDSDFSWCKRLIRDKRIVLENNELRISIVSTPIPDLQPPGSETDRGRV